MPTPITERTRLKRQPHQAAVIEAGERETRSLATLVVRPLALYADEAGTPYAKRAAIAAGDAAPTALSDAHVAGAAFGAVCLHWRNVALATRTSINVQVWAWVTGSGWVKATDGAFTTLGEATEARCVGVAYRPMFVQVTALTGGAGNVDLYLGPEP